MESPELHKVGSQPGAFRPHPTDDGTYQRSLWGKEQQQAAQSGFGATRSQPRWPGGSCRNSLQGSTESPRSSCPPTAMSRVPSAPSATSGLQQALFLASQEH